MNNLKKIVKARNKSLTSIAVEMEISPEAISQYISGKIRPKVDTLIDLAKYLNTSTDYLLDLTDNPNLSDFELNENELTLIQNFRNLKDLDKVKVEAYVQAFVDFSSSK